jgi:hypothetical protein
MKFLVIRKPRIGPNMQPTSQLIRAQKEAVLAAVKRGEADCTYAFVEAAVSVSKTPIPGKR